MAVLLRLLKHYCPPKGDFLDVFFSDLLPHQILIPQIYYIFVYILYE